MGYKQTCLCYISRVHKWTSISKPTTTLKFLSSYHFPLFQNPCDNHPGILPSYHFSQPWLSRSFSNIAVIEPNNTKLTEQLFSDVGNICEILHGKNGGEQDMETVLEDAGIKITNQIVMHVLRKLELHERLALRFFVWAGKQPGYRHETKTYNQMIDLLTSDWVRCREFSLVCKMLDQEKYLKRRILPSHVVLKILEERVVKEQKYLEKNEIVTYDPFTESDAFLILIDTLCKCDLVLEAQHLFEKMKDKLRLNNKIYTVLICGWCRKKKTDKAMQVFNEMLYGGHQPFNFICNDLLAAFCEEGKLDEALKLFHLMRSVNSSLKVSPDARTFEIMILALAKADRADDFETFLNDMRFSGCIPDVSCYSKIIEGLCSADKLKQAYRILEEMSDRGYPPDIVTYNLFLKTLCNFKRKEEALKLIKRMIEAECLPSPQTYVMLLRMLFEIGDVDMAFVIWNEIPRYKCKRIASCYCTFIQGLFDNGRTDDACRFLREAMAMRMKMPYGEFDRFLMALSKSGELRMIQSVSEYMKHFHLDQMEMHYRELGHRKAVSQRRMLKRRLS